MQTLEIGMQKNNSQGFTIIELLVVLFIIGLVTTMMAISVRGKAPSSAEAENQFFTLLTLAQQQAVVNDRVFAVFIDTHVYQIKALNDENQRWKDIASQLGHAQPLPSTVTLEWKEGHSPIVFFPTGEISAFKLAWHDKSDRSTTVMRSDQGQVLRGDA